MPLLSLRNLSVLASLSVACGAVPVADPQGVADPVAPLAPVATPASTPVVVELEAPPLVAEAADADVEPPPLESDDSSAPVAAAEDPKASPTQTPADVAGPAVGAKRRPSGLAFRQLRRGKGGPHPRLTDTVLVHYAGWTADGRLIDASHTRDEPASFPVNAVIKGWTEGLQLMRVGDKMRLWIPAELAYGNDPGGGKPTGQLTFDIELLEIKRTPRKR